METSIEYEMHECLHAECREKSFLRRSPLIHISRCEKEGILLVNKPQGKTSFSLISVLRKLTGIKKIGHAGTLDPFATGVMVLLLGRQYTRLSDELLCEDKEYIAEIYLGVSTDTYDCDGKVVARSKKIPSSEEIYSAVDCFQGEMEQIPPMFSAKKIKGKKLYELAREGITVERKPSRVRVTSTILSYTYPYLTIKVACSKGTYIRSIAHELGVHLGCGAHLSKLKRTRSGQFLLEDCIDGELLQTQEFDITRHLIKLTVPHAMDMNFHKSPTDISHLSPHAIRK